jgi:hypothetical protein
MPTMGSSDILKYKNQINVKNLCRFDKFYTQVDDVRFWVDITITIIIL